jgi:hypothetical protein
MAGTVRCTVETPRTFRHEAVRPAGLRASLVRRLHPKEKADADDDIRAIVHEVMTAATQTASYRIEAMMEAAGVELVSACGEVE